MKKIIKILGIISIIILMMVLSYKVFFKKNILITNMETIDDFGTWKIEFTEDVIIDHEKIKIYDNKGQEVDIVINYTEKEKKTILIKPTDDGYDIGAYYKLVIRKALKNEQNHTLNKEYNRQFSILSKSIIIKKAEIIDDNKTWRIEFNQEILLGNDTYKSIRIIDSNEERLITKLEHEYDNKKVILVKVDNSNYEVNHKYKLILKGELDTKYDSRLENTIEEEFLIDKKIIDRTLGLGKYETEHVSVNREYEWYIDQGNTGKFSDDNCGPAIGVMVVNWFNKELQPTVEEAREIYYPSGGWWYIVTIIDYLQQCGISTKVYGNSGSEFLKKVIDNQNIAILCLDSSKLKIEDNPISHTNKFYKGGSGHFIIVKGYRKVDDKLYFEVYDPNSYNKRYDNGELKGKDRYYEADNLIEAVKNWWNNVIVVEKGE